MELSYATEAHIAQLLAAASRIAVLPGETAAGMGGGGAGAEARSSSHLLSAHIDLSCGPNVPACCPTPTCPYPPAVYTTVKSFLCCRSLDLLGHQWLAVLLAGSFGVVLCGLAFSTIASLDKLGRVTG